MAAEELLVSLTNSLRREPRESFLVWVLSVWGHGEPFRNTPNTHQSVTRGSGMGHSLATIELEAKVRCVPCTLARMGVL